MKKIDCDLYGEPYTDLEIIQNKVNEIVKWINEQNNNVKGSTK